ncbi:MAG: hypothetical protein IJ043_01255 [Clostridia bacterium]|nr:hypothetical protein [Clostridia bacterium]
MEIALPKLGKAAIPLKHFPTRCHAFIFRACEYVPYSKIAEILGVEEQKVRQAAAEMGLPDYDPGNLWLTKGYITIIRRLWNLLPYEQLLQLLDMDAHTFAVLLREDDFLDVKLADKPVCAPVTWQEPDSEQKKRLAEIKKIMEDLELSGVEPFNFNFDVPELKFHGKAVFDTRMIYSFSGLYQNAFEVDSGVYCPDEMLEAYSKLGVNGVWTQGVLYLLTEFPFAPELSAGYEKRIARMRDFADRLDRYGMKLYLYINEPRSMPESFYNKFPHLRGHSPKSDKVCLCTSTREVQDYLKNGIEALCRAVPKLGGFFTITRSENPTNCYSHSLPPDRANKPCTCSRCSKRSMGEVIGEVIGCIAEGAHRVSDKIKVMAWSWAWGEDNAEIIRHLPKDVVLLSQSELAVPFNIGGVEGTVVDYSMSIPGPGERAKTEWKLAKECGLEIGAKVQINTTWECSTVPAMPVYPSIERHISDIKNEGVQHLLLSWTLGGYPGKSIAYAAKYFYDKCEFPAENETEKKAAEIFSQAFKEFPFHIKTLYRGPQNAGPSTLLFDEPTGYESTMTCFAYDDLEHWCSIYPVDVFEAQFAKLCSKWEEGLELLAAEPETETVIMAQAAYCLFKASLNQIRFIRARDSGEAAVMLSAAREELAITEKMLALMNNNAAIGFEAANHYYFSKGQLAEKILNCKYLIEKYN